MRKMPPKHLQMAQKLSLSYIAPVKPTTLYFALLASTLPHFTPHLSTS
jgi:hypothetical protein